MEVVGTHKNCLNEMVLLNALRVNVGYIKFRSEDLFLNNYSFFFKRYIDSTYTKRHSSFTHPSTHNSHFFVIQLYILYILTPFNSN